MEMPQLEGSEKQIVWANDIRQKSIEWLMRQPHLPGNVCFSEGFSDQDKERLLERATKRTNAQWWIDRRLDVKRGGIWDQV